MCVDNNQSVGSHPLIKRFMKGVFSNRPALPKYNVIWDVSVVLNVLKTLYPHNDLSLLVLSQKLVVLLLLLSGHRWQSIHLPDIRNISYVYGGNKITIGDLSKTSKAGMHMSEINLPMFKQDVRILV